MTARAARELWFSNASAREWDASVDRDRNPLAWHPDNCSKT